MSLYLNLFPHTEPNEYAFHTHHKDINNGNDQNVQITEEDKQNAEENTSEETKQLVEEYEQAVSDYLTQTSSTTRFPSSSNFGWSSSTKTGLCGISL